MKHFGGKRLGITLGIYAGLVVAVGVGCLFVGSTGNGWPSREVLPYRLEPVFDAALIGAALAAAGVAYQAILRNPLADPYLLGASSGAMLAAYIWQLPFFAVAAGAIAAFSQQAFAFFCAAGSVLISLGLASRRGRLDKITLLLVGVIVNAVNGSIFLLINALVDPRGGLSPISFLVGGIHSIGADQRWAAIGLITVGWVILLYIAGQLNVAALDDAEAAALGVGLNRLRWITIAAASLMTAAAVAISGPIGFVGLICPHLARYIFGTDQRRLFPAATAIGAILLMIADAACRYLAQSNRLGTELQVGVLTGLLGGPFFLVLLFQSRRAEE
jgi:iron complex transport system permease protein